MLYYWELFDKFQLLECTLNVFSGDVGAGSAQEVPIVDGVPPARRGRPKNSSLPSVGTISEADEESAITKVGEGLIEMVKESKRKLEEMLKNQL